MDLPTYTNIWRIEKRLYKLYDLRLPMPLPIVWIGVFVGVFVPWSLLLVLVGVPVEMPWHVLFLVPPGIVTWLSTRPVIEGKRLTELLESHLRYLGQPKAWYRLAPLAEPETITFSGRVWRTSPVRARSKGPRKARHPQRRREGQRIAGPRQVRPAVAAAAAAAGQAPVAEPATTRTGWGTRRGAAPALNAQVRQGAPSPAPGAPAGPVRREKGLSGGSGRPQEVPLVAVTGDDAPGTAPAPASGTPVPAPGPAAREPVGRRDGAKRDGGGRSGGRRSGGRAERRGNAAEEQAAREPGAARVSATRADAGREPVSATRADASREPVSAAHADAGREPAPLEPGAQESDAGVRGQEVAGRSQGVPERGSGHGSPGEAEARAAHGAVVPIKTAESRKPAAGKPIDTEALRRLRRLAASADAPADPTGRVETAGRVESERREDEVARDQHRKGQPPRLGPALVLSGTKRVWPPLNPDAKPLPRPGTSRPGHADGPHGRGG
ncbi:TcpE family conjugal transfer membrane protein, partial [Nonomuraea basaltis]|uniref:TcpE family conjugal transfer membrane protein n=1 Tax=Nonomuraea basaltis TaxID=2495887 RepID=UPI001F0FA17E